MYILLLVQLCCSFQIWNHRFRIRTQHFRLNTDTEPGIVFMTKNWKKFTTETKFSYFFDKKFSIYLSLGFHKGRQIYRRPSALKREHPAVQNMKFLDFFLFCELRIQNPDPDPLTWLIQIRIRNTTVLYMKVLTSTFMMFLMRPTWAHSFVVMKNIQGKKRAGTVRTSQHGRTERKLW